FQSVAYDRASHTMFGGTQDNGTPGKTIGNSYWAQLPNGGGDGAGVAASSNSHNESVDYYFATSHFRRNGDDVSLSGLTPTDAQTVQNNITNSVDGGFPVTVAANNPRHILVGLSHLYESTDGGDNVSDITPFLGSTVSLGGFAFAGQDSPNVVYLAT